MGQLVNNLSDAIELLYVCNNASWSIGEIASRAEKEVRILSIILVPYLPSITSTVHM